MARDIIVIGGSSGALQALKELFGGLSASLPASIFVVLHINSHGDNSLPRILSTATSLNVRYARDDQPLEHGTIYLAPSNYHLRLEQNAVELDTGPKENRQRPSIDALFRSAAWFYGPRVIGVILTGALDDGTAGLWQIKKHGGVAVAQSPEEALDASMPRSAIRQVHVDYIVPVKQMPQLLLSLCAGGSTRSTAIDPSRESGL